MKNNGKKVCDYLREVRHRVADENGIDLPHHECTFQGECSGTCPRCEAEVRYLETELQRRSIAGKAALVAGVAMAAASFASCTEGKPDEPMAWPETDTLTDTLPSADSVVNALEIK